MADSSVDITHGTGTSIDTRTESTNGNHRQVMVIGDPATNAGVAPVDATAGLKVDLGADNDVTVSSGTISTITNVVHVDDNSSTLSVDDGGGSLTVDATSLPLPTGAATAAKQLADNHNVVVTSAPTTAVTGTFWQATQPVSLASVPSHAVTNAGTFVVQTQDGSGNNLVTTTTVPSDAARGLIVAAKGTGATGSAIPANAGFIGGTDGTNLVGAKMAAHGLNTATGLLASGVAGEFDDTSPTSVTENQFGHLRISANRNLYGTIRDAAGNERGANVTAANALSVDGSAVTQPVSIATAPVLVAGSAIIGKVGIDQTTPGTTNLVALAANQSVNVAQMNGTTVTMGNGVAGTGVQRVTLASDSTGQVALAAGSALVGKVGIDQTTPGTTNAVVDTPVTSGGLSIVTGSVGATATAIKASAGQLYGYHLFNTTAAVAYVQIFNVAAASVTLNTTVPTFSIGIPASGGVTVNFDKGIAFSTAISFACTTTRTGLTGATVDVNFLYK